MLYSPNKKRHAWLFILLCVSLVLMFVFSVRRFGKLLVKLSEWSITDDITIAVNNAVTDILDATDGSAVILTTDSTGNVSSAQIDTAYVNRLQVGIINRLYELIPDTEQAIIKVPLGIILGSKLFSGSAPYIPVKILSVTNIEPTLKDDFESVGINQTRHRIYLQIEIQLSVLVPGYEGLTYVNTDVLIAETIISGGVPNTIIDMGRNGE